MRIWILVLLCTTQLGAQSNVGELRLKVTDPSGFGIQSSVILVSEANGYNHSFVTDDAGNLTIKLLEFGQYRLQVLHEGLAPAVEIVVIHSAVPTGRQVILRITPVQTTVEVSEAASLIDPNRIASVSQVSLETLDSRPVSLPGRSLQDVVNSQPGWLYEGNAVLHPRGTEYQTQFVLDGIPLTDNRSPGHGTEIEANNIRSMSIYTAGIPAEYGRKMGGVVEVNTSRDTRSGVHGQLVLSGGSFSTADAYAGIQYLAGKNTFGMTAGGGMSDRYLSPPVPDNYTNNGTTADFAASYERDFNPSDRLSLMFRHELARYNVPNEQVQEAAGQRQNGSISEDLGIARYQHVFSSSVVGNVGAMFRTKYDDLSSNLLSTPVIAFQRNSFSEAYFRGSVSVHHNLQEWKIGVESDNSFLRERFADAITDPSQFDPGTPARFSFAGTRPDLEQSAFVQDLIRLGRWTVSAGVRWDHYQLILNQNAVSPRLGVSRYFAHSNLLVHAAYDRVFQTPSSDDILISSSLDVAVLNPNVLHVPVQPSQGNYLELGATKGLVDKVSLGINGYLRKVKNFADDNLLLNTPVAFPIAFDRARIYGAEGKLNIPSWGRLSGFVSYSYMVGSAYFPVTGGLFLGQAATDARTQLGGRFWVTQDQRNTLRTRFRYQFVPRLWGAAGVEYGSGLPVDFDGTYEEAIAEYGHDVVNRVDFARGRVRPSLSLDASIGTEFWKRDTASLQLQFDAQNLNNRLNLINFAGLFSGNSIAPPRAYYVRLKAEF